VQVWTLTPLIASTKVGTLRSPFINPQLWVRTPCQRGVRRRQWPHHMFRTPSPELISDPQ
jgi:hypothetical protein